MKRLLAIANLAALILSATFLGRAQEKQPDFRALYDTYAAAVRRMDRPAYQAFFADDFTMKDPEGKIHDRAEMDKYSDINAKTTKRVNFYTVEIEAVSPQPDAKTNTGDVAVIVLQKYDRDQAPIDQPDKPHNIRTSVVQREVWTPTKQGWKIRRIEEILNGPVYFDGKPMAGS